MNNPVNGIAVVATSMISHSTVGHLADSFQGLPDDHVIVKYLIPKSKSYLVYRVYRVFQSRQHVYEDLLGTSAMISVGHLPDSLQGLPDAQIVKVTRYTECAEPSRVDNTYTRIYNRHRKTGVNTDGVRSQ
jgi:hypothetical protein